MTSYNFLKQKSYQALEMKQKINYKLKKTYFGLFKHYNFCSYIFLNLNKKFFLPMSAILIRVLSYVICSYI